MSEAQDIGNATTGNGATTGLRRQIGLGPAVALYVGAVVGAGVLILPGTAAALAGPGSLVAWLIDSLLGIPIALSFAALAARYPDAGGVAVYVARAFGPGWGAMVGWFYFVAAAVGQAAVALTGGYYLAHALRGGPAMVYGTAATILAVAVTANLRGIRLTGRMQMALSAGVACMLAVAALAALPRIAWPSLSSSLLGAGGWHAGAIGRTCVLLFFAFFGWEAIAHLSEEFRDPARDAPRATLLAVGVVTLLYLGIGVAVVGTGTFGTAEVNRTAVARLIGAAFGVRADAVAAVAAMLISLGTANAFVAAASRLGYALARDGAFPAPLARLNPAGAPGLAVLTTGAIAGATLAASLVGGFGAARILAVPNSLGIATYVLGLAAAVKLLRGWPRAWALLALLPTLAILPFSQAGLALPVLVGAAALAYRRLRGR